MSLVTAVRLGSYGTRMASGSHPAERLRRMGRLKSLEPAHQGLVRLDCSSAATKSQLDRPYPGLMTQPIRHSEETRP
jgi:hypothetical protein